MFIDDCSKDNSVKIIEYYKREDERINLVKQKNNKGTLISRNIGVLLAKGTFVTIPDSDDILSQKILKICYEATRRYNYDMIRFNYYEQKTKGAWMKAFNQLGNLRIYQPELSTFIFYGLGYLRLNDFLVTNKLIKRDLYIRALNDIKPFYLNQYMIILEDELINYSLHLNANSLYLMQKIGYYKIYNKNSVTQKKKKKKNMKYKFLFLYLKFIYENTKNNKYEKDMAFFILNKYIKKINILKSINNEFEFYLEILIKYLNCKFIDNTNKIKIVKMIELIKNSKNNNILSEKNILNI